MYLDAIALEARNPLAHARFWSAALGVPARSRGAAGFELCTPRVSFRLIPAPEGGTGREEEAVTRLHLDLHGGPDQAAFTRRLLTLGADRRDVGQGDVPWEVLADTEGHLFCVMPGTRYDGTGPGLGALPIDSASPRSDRDFWSLVTGWTPVGDDGGDPALRHPDGSGPRLAFCAEVGAKPAGVRNAMGLVVGLDDGERSDEAHRRLLELGARPAESDPGAPWRLLTDPSGNEFRLATDRPGA
ncbi:VOC family protein [Nocardiopsis sp. YSL2]|uniref:VOC family protein n=1 Tax=Nocardiopsis sp. YSL2 TaxID=2939492 RepID=UPI0026F41247|nr:VOC family protein [Nocardiopsis sp. YSL2]